MGQRLQMAGIPCAQCVRQGDQGGAVIDCIHGGKIIGRQKKNVALKDGQVTLPVAVATLPGGDLRLAVQGREQVGDGFPGQLRADHAVALLQQIANIQCLATQGQKKGLPGFQ